MSIDSKSKGCSSSSSGLNPMEVLEGEVPPILGLPAEVLDIILNQSGLSDLDKVRAGEVCPLWRRIVKHRPHPEVTVYGKRVWEGNIGYSINGEIPPLPSRVEVLETLLSLEGKLEQPGRIMLALMPQGLTFNKLRPLIENPQEGHATPIRHIWNPIVQKLGEKAIEESCWVLFSESVMKESRSKTYAQQKALVANRTNSLCGLPEMIVAVACVALKRVKTGERILSVQPEWTYTRCQETINEQTLIVGCFSSEGLYVNGTDYVFDCHGVAVCRKF